MVAHPSLSIISADDVSNVSFKIILAALFWSFNIVLVSLWFYYLTLPLRKRIRVTKNPLTPHLYIVKLRFTEGIHYFLIFALKHRLWVRVRTASVYPQSMFRAKIRKISQFFT